MNKMKRFFAALAVAALMAGTSYAATYRLGSMTDVDFNHVKTLTKTTTYTVATTDAGALINADATSAGFTITLPALSTVAASGQTMAIKVIKTDSSTNIVTLAAATGDTIGGESYRKLINQNGYIVVESSAQGWQVSFESPYAVEDHEAGTLSIGTISYDATVVFEGATADAYETTFGVVDPTADGNLYIPALASGTTQYTMMTSLATNILDAANSVTGTSNGVRFEGATADAYETTLSPTDPTADRAITLPDAAGAVVLNVGPGSYKSTESTTTTDTLTTADCGKTLFLNSATEFVTTLPAPTDGCYFKVVVKAAPSGASYTVVTASSANVIHGQISTPEDAAGAVSTAAAADVVTFVDGKAIQGDYVDFISDGTSWYISGMCNVQDGISTAQGS